MRKKKTTIKVGDRVHYGEGSSVYEVAEIKEFPHGTMIGIYDEPPSKHVDYLHPSSVRKATPKKKRP